MNDPISQFRKECKENVAAMVGSHKMNKLSHDWIIESSKYKYSYNFTWLGRPIIQYPQDIIAMQEIIWNVKPDLIIETGIAHGGFLIFYASLLEIIGGDGEVIGVDIDIREHNRVSIENHQMYKRITMIEGSSVDEDVARHVHELAKYKSRILIALDSNHTHEHVLRELELYSPLVTRGSYCVVFDTIIEDMPDDSYPNRPWGRGNNPKTAIREFLRNNDRFEIDKEMEEKLLLTMAPGGYLKCLKD